MGIKPLRGGTGRPFYRRLRRSPALLGAVLIAALFVPVLTASRPSANPGGRSTPVGLLQSRVVPSAKPTPQTVALVTGDKVRLTAAPGGRSVISPMPSKPD